MKNLLLHILLLTFLIMGLSNCARDLSSNVYTSDATQSFTLEGRVLSVRKVTIKSEDQLGDNTGGALAGGAMGAALGSGIGGGTTGTAAGMIGGAIIGGTAGTIIKSSLSKSEGYEYIVKLDKANIKDDRYYDGSVAMRHAISSAIASGLITVVQGTDEIMSKGQKVYVIISNKRTRIIPAS